MYTKLNEDTDQLGGVDASTGNEGQKLVWGLQDIKLTLNDKEIEAPSFWLAILLTIQMMKKQEARRTKRASILRLKRKSHWLISLKSKGSMTTRHSTEREKFKV